MRKIRRSLWVQKASNTSTTRPVPIKIRKGSEWLAKRSQLGLMLVMKYLIDKLVGGGLGLFQDHLGIKAKGENEKNQRKHITNFSPMDIAQLFILIMGDLAKEDALDHPEEIDSGEDDT